MAVVIILSNIDLSKNHKLFYMSMKNERLRLCLVGLMLTLSLPAWSQWREILHQTFEADSIRNVQLDIFGDYEIEPWAGNTILTETKVGLDCGNKNILEFLIEQGRYVLEGKRTGADLLIVSKDKVRNPMRTNDQDCEETARVRIFLPDDFEQTGDHSWRNPDPKGIEENEHD